MALKNVKSHWVLLLSPLLFFILLASLIKWNDEGFDKPFNKIALIVFSVIIFVVQYLNISNYIIIFILFLFTLVISLYLSNSNGFIVANVMSIATYIIFFSTLYARLRKTDFDLVSKLSSFDKKYFNLFEFRNNYTKLLLIMLVYIVLLTTNDITINYAFIVLLVILSIILVILIIFCQVALLYPSDRSSGDVTLKMTMFINSLTTLSISIGMSTLVIYSVMYGIGLSTNTTLGAFIINFFLVATLIGCIYKFINIGGRYFENTSIYKLISSVFLYIPCLLTNYIPHITKTKLEFSTSINTNFAPAKPYEYIILISSIIALTSYLLWITKGESWLVSTYLKQGGKQIVDDPINLNSQTNLASYSSIITPNDPNDNKISYKYAISFWYYIDSFNQKSGVLTNIISFSDIPTVYYSSNNNKVVVTVPNNDNNVEKEPYEKNILDSKDNRIIYSDNALLQKWNHMLINYNGGTMDVFHNGKLVSSAIKVSNYVNQREITVGSDNGASGNIANIMFFDKPLGYLTINRLYHSLKSKNPPTIN